jgi:hypothetical protein
MEKQVYEKDWERFDGFTPTFRHPNLSEDELRFLLSAAYNRFYVRPSCLANYWRVQKQWLVDLVDHLDRSVEAVHSMKELFAMSRRVEC